MQKQADNTVDIIGGKQTVLFTTGKHRGKPKEVSGNIPTRMSAEEKAQLMRATFAT